MLITLSYLMFSQSGGIDICITTHFAENQRATGRFMHLPLITQSGRRTLEPVSLMILPGYTACDQLPILDSAVLGLRYFARGERFYTVLWYGPGQWVKFGRQILKSLSKRVF